MIRINEIKMPLGATEEEVKIATAKALKIKENDIKSFTLARRSIDSRKKDNIILVYSVEIETELDEEKIKLRREYEKVEEPIVPYVTHIGDLTGYSADCPACNGTLACKPTYNVYKNGVVSYYDNTYGNVRIVATSKNIPCGSIIKYNDTYAIVLDRGVLGYDVDLLVESEDYARQYVGRSKITYEIIRSGW